MSFLTRFSIVSFVATTIVAVALAWGLSDELANNAIRQAAEATAAQVHAVIERRLGPEDFLAPFDSAKADTMDETLATDLHDSGVTRVKLWSPEGMVLYSDQRELIGMTFPVKEDLGSALDGSIHAEVTDLSAAENMTERTDHSELLEVYAPIRFGGSTTIAVYEVYRDTATLRASIDRMRIRVWLGALGGFLLVYIALFGIAHRASRALVASEQETRDRLQESLLVNSILQTSLAETDSLEVLRRICDDVGRSFSAACTPARMSDAEGGSLLGSSQGYLQLPRPASHAVNAPTQMGPYTIDEVGESGESPLSRSLDQRGTASALLIPLPHRSAEGALLVLESDSPRTWSQADRRTAAAVARAAAVAADNSLLLAELRHSNEELAAAYDSTIEGWARALDLRDHETEGHCRRVTDLTLALLRAAGVGGEALEHGRRGALLHDIGKMGVPDAILLKPGPLTDEEWEIMRRHPAHAKDFLSPIVHLRPAIDIPYGHHEHWDGTGYPEGRSGEEIPFTARVFAAVDIWDALLSDRPYRPAWSEERALDYIQSLSGTHLDPDVVRLFVDAVAPGIAEEPRGLRRAS